MTSTAARCGVGRFGVAAKTLGGSFGRVTIGRAVDALSGSRSGSVSAVAARSAARRRICHSADFDRLDEQRLRLSTADAHRLPLEDVESGRKLDGRTRPPLALFGHRRPAGLVSAARHTLAQFILGLFVVRSKKFNYVPFFENSINY